MGEREEFLVQLVPDRMQKCRSGVSLALGSKGFEDVKKSLRCESSSGSMEDESDECVNVHGLVICERVASFAKGIFIKFEMVILFF